MKLKAILFDHDGTIADSEFAHFKMWRDVLRHYGVELSEQEYTSQYAGIPTTANAKTIVDNYSLNIQPTALVFAKAKSTNHFLSKQAFPLMAGAFESIQTFYDQGLKVGIVTGAGKEGVDSTLVNHGLDRYVSVVVSADDVNNSKPAPDCYVLAMEKPGLQASECLAIEDTYNGSLSASRAGIECIGVSLLSNVRKLFTETVFVCSDLSVATHWISQNYELPNAS